MYVFVVSVCDFWLSGSDCMSCNSGYCVFCIIGFLGSHFSVVVFVLLLVLLEFRNLCMCVVVVFM